jgi:hypothetical protein
MKVNVVRDRDGKVVATYENAVAGGPAVKPVLKSGHTVHEVEAEENYLTDLKAFYERHSLTSRKR